MARHVKRSKPGRAIMGGSAFLSPKPFILFTTQTYSNTTAGHLSDVRRAIPAGTPVYHVHDVTADRYAEHLENFRKLEAEAVKLAGQAKRARSRASEYLAEAAGTIANANTYAAAVGLRERLEECDPEAVAGWAAEALEREAAAKKRESKRAKAEAARLMVEWGQRLSEWRGGGQWPGNCPDRSHPLARVAFLRVRGQRLETSLRAIVPLPAVLPILAKVRSGHGYNVHERAEAGEVYSVDGFELREINQEARRVVIGCHTITFDEIARAAKSAGL